jgi:uncharacterized membrane protein
MPGLEHGLNRAIGSFLSGVVTGFALKALSLTGFLDEHLISTMIILLGLASVLDFLTRMKYWSTTYILGFIFGYLLVAYIFGIDIFMLITMLFAIYIVAKRIFK